LLTLGCSTARKKRQGWPETEKERMAGGVDDAEVDEDEQILAAWPP
jgi:hypothetical protein